MKKYTRGFILLSAIFCLFIVLPSAADAAPPKVKGVKVTRIKSNAATVKWDSARSAVKYVVKVRRPRGRLVKTVRTTKLKTMVKGLKKKTSYKVSVKAKNKSGEFGKRSKNKFFTTKSRRNYHSSKYMFSLDFPKAWRKYIVAKTVGPNGAAIGFGLRSAAEEEVYSMFMIIVFHRDYWKSINGRDVYGPPLMKNDKYVYVWTHAQDTASDLFDRMQEVPSIISTIKSD